MQAEILTHIPEAALGVARSFSGRRWILRTVDREHARGLAERANIPVTLAQLLIARGVGEGEIADYLNPTLKRLLPEPRLLAQMDEAVARAQRAIESGERIAVFGDYDVDGSSSAAMMHEFLTAVGSPPRIYIPDRTTEGYGPSARAMEILKGEGASLVITVDCGAGAQEALQAAHDSGLDVIVLDHHAVHSAPPAVAHVNPNQADDGSGLGFLCAAGVAFLFLVALNRSLREAGYYGEAHPEPDLRTYLDLVGLATVCDVVPLIGVNRAFVRGALGRLANSERPGIAALAAIAKVTPPITPHHLGFMFGPRINAGGRIGKCSLGVELLTARDRAAADEIATLLDLHNRERQTIEKSILEQAVVMAGSQTNAPYVLVANEGWHSGVVGVVAGRLKDRFAKPSFVIGLEGGMGRGSARSVAGIDVGTAVRGAYEQGLIDAGGGHAMAAGFALRSEQLAAFESFLAERFTHAAEALATANELAIEAFVSPAGATPALIEDMARAGPFGAGNLEPIVVVPDARLLFADPVGKDHVRLRVAGGDGTRLDAIAFRCADQPLGKALLSSRGRQVHLAGRLRADEWQGRHRVQLHIEDAAAAGV